MHLGEWMTCKLVTRALGNAEKQGILSLASFLHFADHTKCYLPKALFKYYSRRDKAEMNVTLLNTYAYLVCVPDIQICVSIRVLMPTKAV